MLILQNSALPASRCGSKQGRSQLSTDSYSRRLGACAAAGNRQPDHDKRCISSLESGQLRNVVIATALCCAFAGNVGAARAESQNWLPRRHHRHIGERFTDTWADTIVEVLTNSFQYSSEWLPDLPLWADAVLLYRRQSMPQPSESRTSNDN